MATAKSVGSAFEKIGVHLECNICTDKYKKPKVLDCLHSFCKECLVKYRDGTHRNKPKIPCPVCRQETSLPESGIQGLKTNFHLAGLIEEFELQEKVTRSAEAKSLCQACDKGNEARDNCLDCEKNICKDCCKSHQQFPVLKNHIIASFDDIRQGKVTKQPDEYRCHKHKEGMKLYCKTCKELICQLCIVDDHPTAKHNITDTATASREYRQSLQADLPALNRGIQGLELSLKDTAEAKTVVKENTAKARKGVQDRAAEVIVKVKAEEKLLQGEISTQEREQNKHLDEHEKTLSNMLQRKRHSLQTTQDLASNASDCDLLFLYPVISKDMDKLKRLPSPKAKRLKLHSVFVQNQKLVIDLGKVMVEDTWKMCHSFGKKGCGKGEFQTARGITADAYSDEIAVADWRNRRVVICHRNGQTQGSIPINANDVVAVSNKWMCANPGKVRVYHKDTLLPACEFGILQRSMFGETDGQLTSVAVMPNGNIVVGDKKMKVLTEHNSRNGDILHTMRVKIRPCFLAVLCNGWIVISDTEQGLVEIVDVSDGNAVRVATIQPTIGGEPVKYCNGVCSNSSGIYLAMDTGEVNTGHIHNYDFTGQFVSCVAQGLYSPQGITFTADGQQLAVADWNSIKIYHKV